MSCITSSDSYWMDEVSMDTLAQNLRVRVGRGGGRSTKPQTRAGVVDVCVCRRMMWTHS